MLKRSRTALVLILAASFLVLTFGSAPVSEAKPPVVKTEKTRTPSKPVPEAKMLVVKTEKARIRSGPGPDYTTLWMVGDGFPLMQIKQEKEWVNVRDMEGDTGWIHASIVQPADIVVVSSKVANLRKGPGAKDDVVLKCERGVVLRGLERKGEWIKVKHAEGEVGWVHRKVVWGGSPGK